MSELLNHLRIVRKGRKRTRCVAWQRDQDAPASNADAPWEVTGVCLVVGVDVARDDCFLGLRDGAHLLLLQADDAQLLESVSVAFLWPGSHVEERATMTVEGQDFHSLLVFPLCKSLR